jgi:hypothetical protein
MSRKDEFSRAQSEIWYIYACLYNDLDVSKITFQKLERLNMK